MKTTSHNGSKTLFRAQNGHSNAPPAQKKKKKPNRHTARGVTPHDAELGKRLRLRRVEQKMSQDTLGKVLNVSFQQVQKYEKGVNRLSAARLQQVATALDVPVTFFYDGDKSKSEARAGREVESLLFLDSAFSLRLLRAYSKIEDQDVQRHFVTLMESVAGIE